MRRQAIFCLLLQLIFELSSCTHLRVAPGTTLKLPCVSFQTDFYAETITWQFNGGDIGAQSLSSAAVKKDGLYLSISPVTTAHEGTYVCSVKKNDMELIRIYNITVVASIGYEIKVNQGSDVHLPCNLPPSSRVETNALWFKETGGGRKTLLNQEGTASDDSPRVNLRFPLDHDQSITIGETVMEDAGIYHCESVEGQKLSSVYLSVVVPPTLAPYSCSGFLTPWEPCQDENSRIGGPLLQESMTEFSMKLYSYIRESNPTTNLLFSPISISMALSHLLLGARGDTRKAIQTAVCVPHDFHCVHFQMKKLREKLSSSLQIASQIYYNPQISLNESFANQSMQFYEAQPVRLLETSEKNTQMINEWVANKTKHKITHLIDFVSPNAQIILLNAVSFSGQWKVKFAQKHKKGLFSKLDGDLVPVPLLYHRKYMATMTYVVELKAQVARFSLTGDSSLYIVLPRDSKASDLQEVEVKMTDTAVHQMIEQMKTTPPQHIEVTLPQIKLNVEPDMNILLKKLGLSSLFEGGNLCGLYSEDQLVLDDAKHRAFLELNERGVEAAAATSMSFSRSFPSFSALRPFIMLLWSDQANVPLFIGRVTDP
ncbi:plasma protease C1 inhibitor [Scomber japonicus]|uniref:plasma protease C1 inhibitor n=1 Tax=Scomber japonicus TaxID=13676 RepID=UPI0023054AB3|nr:plasma protease C1 inhibitor [Scomber japonicus]